MDLGGGKPGPADILQGLPHIGHEAPDFGGGGVGDGLGGMAEHGMAHAGDLQDGHGPNMARAGSGEKVSRRNPFTTVRRCVT